MTAASTAPVPQLTYHLADVAKRAAQHKTFEIPTHAERRAIPIGHYAKLVFCDITAEGARQPAAERMWVEVSAKVEGGGDVYYVGELSNRPAYIEGLREGDAVRFEPKHVCGIAAPSEDDAA